MPFTDISSILEFFLNILEFFLLLSSFFVFLLLQSKFSKAIETILEPIGFNFILRLNAIIACRKTPFIKRAFIEFALLETKGEVTGFKKWKEIINKFKANFDNNKDWIYTVQNCTSLQNEKFSEAVDRYFDFFSQEKNKRAFGITDSCYKWVTNIIILEAYITPSCLLMGLLSQYEDNWTEFIKRYISTVNILDNDSIEHNDVLSNEIYLTFAWLLWGPSFELNYKENWAGLCQISYGDECNSLQAVIKRSNEKSNKLSKIFEEKESHQFGFLSKLNVSIYPNKAFYSEIREGSSLDDAYFYEKIENNNSPFALMINDFSEEQNYKARKYYCTAYVWVLFELNNGNSQDFKPEKSVAFFEHANLTDKAVYQFLVETMIDKSIRHFEQIFSNSTFNGRNYRLVCSLNNRITQRVIERYQQKFNENNPIANQFKRRISLTPTHTPSEVFAAYDEFFSTSNNYLFEEVTLENKKSIDLLGQFYTSVYLECFPNEDEIETFNNLLFYLKQVKGSSEYKYHIILIKNIENEILGGCIFDYFKNSNDAMIEFIAIKPNLQSSGIGQALYTYVLNSVLLKDAKLNKHSHIGNLFCEVDTPEYCQLKEKKYLHFWNKNHFKRIHFTYFQPSLSKNQHEITGLWLAVNKISEPGHSIEKNTVLSLLRDYMKFAMQIQDPESNVTYLKMRDDIQQHETLTLDSLIGKQA